MVPPTRKYSQNRCQLLISVSISSLRKHISRHRFVKEKGGSDASSTELRISEN